MNVVDHPEIDDGYDRDLGIWYVTQGGSDGRRVERAGGDFVARSSARNPPVDEGFAHQIAPGSA